jgi:hypothetical protein
VSKFDIMSCLTKSSHRVAGLGLDCLILGFLADVLYMAISPGSVTIAFVLLIVRRYYMTGCMTVARKFFGENRSERERLNPVHSEYENPRYTASRAAHGGLNVS